MKKVAFINFGFGVKEITFLIALNLIALISLSQNVVKVGAFNFYPGIFQDDDGSIKGFYIDALNEIAQKENIEFQYIYGTWDEGLRRIKSGEVDMLTSVAFTEERNTYMDYCSTPLLTVWGELYIKPNTHIHGILSLEGKSVAIMKSDYNGSFLKNMVEKLAIDCKFIETSGFEEVFKLIANGEVDAGVVNNTFGGSKSYQYDLMSSEVVFNPFNIYFTVKKDENSALLALLDNYLNQWVHNSNSVYNKSRQEWTHAEIGVIQVFPNWLKKIAYPSLILVLGLFVFLFLLRNQVKKATLKVKYSEELFKVFMHYTPASVYIKDKNLEHIYSNRLTQNTKDTSSKNLPNSAETIQDPQIAELVEKSDRLILNGEKKYENIKYECKTDHGISWLDDHKFFVKQPNGQPAVGGITFDITENKNKENQLTLKNIVFHSSISANSISDRNGILTDVNTAFLDFWSYESINEVIGKPITDFLKHENESSAIINALNTRGYWSGEYTALKKDGSEFIALANASSIIDSNNNFIGYQSSVFDITVRKEAENALIKAKQKAEESDRLKSAFLSNMSHEIRTPMNGILGFTELLQEPDMSIENKNDYINIIQKSADRLLNTVNDIVEISQIESGEVYIRKEDVDLISFLETHAKFYEKEAIEKGLDFNIQNNIESSSFIFQTDNNKLNSIVSNLIKNAIKYTNEGTIIIGFSITKDQILFSCKDTGIGIPEHRLDAIFNRFEQSDIEDKAALEGSGLGLSIVESYVKMLDGKIWVESEYGKGSVFYVSFPLNDKPNLNPENHIEGANKTLNTLEMKVLIVEDDEISAKHLTILTEKLFKTYQLATNGKEAISLLKQEQSFDLVLMDMKMPILNGFEATRKIREFNKDIIIISQTAFAFEEDKEKMLKAGCNDIITKPVNSDELIRVISKYFET